jgi:hypothetical protein
MFFFFIRYEWLIAHSDGGDFFVILKNQPEVGPAELKPFAIDHL